MKIQEIISLENQEEIIKKLKAGRPTPQPDVQEAKNGLDPLLHEVFDYDKRPNKLVKVDAEEGGIKKIDPETGEAITVRYEPVARIAIAIQKLIVKRASAFLFGNPVKLEAEMENANQEAVMTALNRILHDVKADSMNRKIAREVFSCTEAAEIWYPVEKTHSSYGFNSKYKLRAAVFSPLLGDKLYPYFDDNDDMVAFSREFTRVGDDNKTRTMFETYTDQQHFMWEMVEKGAEMVEGYPREIAIGKIPVIYASQPDMEWADVQVLIDRLEKLLSNFADTNDYHAAPKIFVKGHLTGFAKKGESGAIIEGDKDSEASYLSWQHAPESVKLEIETLLQMIYTLTQTPDISFDSVKGIGAISGVALKLLFMDAHLKAVDKKEIFDAYMQRRVNVIKAFIGKLNTGLAVDAENLMVKPEITPYMIDDEKSYIDLLTSANGGKPVVSQKRSVQLAGLANDTDEDFRQLEAETAKENAFILGEPTDM